MADADALAKIEALIARVALGDQSAFSRLYAHTSAKLFGVCVAVLGDRAAAEEAVQEAYIKVWNRAATYRAGQNSPMSWLITVARNAAIDRRRASREAARRAAVSEAEQVTDPAPSPEGQAVARSEAVRIAHCLEELDRRHADAVRGAYLRGDSYAALAERHAVPLNTMRSWLRRSLVKLRECLTQ